MASNLNKAFMRAYAKDRSATPGEPQVPTAPTPVATSPMPAPASVPMASAIPTAPIARTPVAPAPQRAPHQPGQPGKAATQQGVFSGRYSTPATTTSASSTSSSSAPATSAPAPATPAPAPRSAVPAPRAATPAPAARQFTAQTVVAQPAARQQTTAPQATAPQAAVTQAAAPQRTAPPRTAQPTYQATTPAFQPRVQPQATTNAVTSSPVTSSATADEASQVWRRIDEAHSAQQQQPMARPNRPTAAVGAAKIAPPRRSQAAAATPTAAPAPVRSVPQAPQFNDDQLPLLGDEATDQSDSKSADARRRTVADFLYSAGQYNPGRILASSNATEHTSAATMPAATALPLHASDAMHSQDESHFAPTMTDHYAAEPAYRSSATGTPTSTSTYPTSQAPVYDMQETMQPAVEEPMPRRMGQILRVDVPRNMTSATAPVVAAQASPALAPAAAPVRQSPVLTTSLPAASKQASGMPVSSMPASMSQSSTSQSSMPLEAPVAKYVIEQRRLDRAHKINEAEEKLRSNTHKIFNPVWEVDNLQWPSVVDKLMQQRADSMAAVAAHMKSACEDGLSILGVTSAEKSEGRTTVACCLARLAAAHGLNVCLVDIDLDHPTLCIQTNMEVEHDWRDCMSEDISLEEVAVHSIEDQLTVLPLKPRGGRPGMLASDGRIAELLDQLSESFELVIVDCSRTASSGNVITGLAHTKIFDAAIVVVDRRDTHQDRVEDAVRMIQQTGIESIGIVDNFSM